MRRKAGRHQRINIEASSVRNKKDFLLSVGLVKNTDTVTLETLSSTCNQCKQMICRCHEKQMNTKANKLNEGRKMTIAQWTHFLKPCKVVIAGTRCTLCAKSFKCITDLRRHFGKKHKKKATNVAIVFKIGKEVMLRVFLDKKYIIPLELEDNSASIDTELRDSIPYFPSMLEHSEKFLESNGVSEVNWPSLRIYKSVICSNVSKPPSDSFDSSYEKDLSDTNNNQTPEWIQNLINPVGDDCSDDIEELLRVTTSMQPEFSSTRLNSNLLPGLEHELYYQLNEDYGHLYKEDYQETIEKCDDYLPDLERNYIFEVKDDVGCDNKLSMKKEAWCSSDNLSCEYNKACLDRDSRHVPPGIFKQEPKFSDVKREYHPEEHLYDISN